MSDEPLANLRVMVVEDEYLLAEDIRRALQEAGAEVVGPVGDSGKALALLEDGGVDLAVLDIDIKGEPVFPVALSLRRANVPFIFASGFSRQVIPGEYLDVVHLQKPISVVELTRTLAGLREPRCA